MYVGVEAFASVQALLNQLDVDDHADGAGSGQRQAVMLRVVDELWPFPPHYPLAPQPLAALDLLDYPDRPRDAWDP